MMHRRITARVRKVCAAGVATLALIAGGIAAAPMASAAMTAGFSASNLIVEGSAEGNARDVPRTFSFDWSFTEGEKPQPGDGFEVQLNGRLRHTENWVTIPMTTGDREIGSCLVEYQVISCTVDDRIAELDDNTSVSGQLATKVVAFQAPSRGPIMGYFKPTIPFKFNGKTVDVAIPNGIAGAADKSTETVVAYGSTIELQQEHVDWIIDFAPSALANAGNFTQPDGTTDISYTFKVKLSEDFDLAQFEHSPWQLRELSGGENGGFTGMNTLVNTGDSPRDGFSIDVSGDGTEKTVTVSGPFKTDHRYSLYLPTAVKELPIPRDKEFNLTVALDGYGQEVSGRAFTDNYSETPEEFGVVTLRATSSTDIPVKVTNRIKGKLQYDLPGETKASDYPEWKFRPHEINDDDQSGTLTVDLEKGFTETRIAAFPAGTTVSFEADEPDWYAARVDHSKTTVEPKELTVEKETLNRITVTYAVEGQRAFAKVGVIKTGDGANATVLGPNNVKLSYTCTRDGEEYDSGEEEISAAHENMDEVGLFLNTECVLKIDPNTVTLPEGYTLDTEKSVLERQVNPSNEMEPILFETYFAAPVTQDTEVPAVPADLTESYAEVPEATDTGATQGEVAPVVIEPEAAE